MRPGAGERAQRASAMPIRDGVLRAMIEIARCLRCYRVSTRSIDQSVADYAIFLAMIFSSRRYRALRAMIRGARDGRIREAHLHCIIEPAALNLLTVIRAASGKRDDPLFLSRADLVKAIRFVERQAAILDLHDPAALERLTGQVTAYIGSSLQSFPFIRSPTDPSPLFIRRASLAAQPPRSG
jgi:hypothetical protein